jgi:hypothetical protein
VDIRIIFQGVWVPLYGAQIAAGYAGDALETGLLRGFVTKADADATQLSIAGIGTVTLSSVLAGSPTSCATGKSDMDHDPFGREGWWFYLNFHAVHVPYTE